MVKLAPRWAIADVKGAEVEVGYGASKAGLIYEFEWNPAADQITLKLEREAEISLHLLRPDQKIARNIKISGKEISFQNIKIRDRIYWDAEFRVAGKQDVVVSF